jgi:glucose-1-phosphate thymidylyltransferase
VAGAKRPNLERGAERFWAPYPLGVSNAMNVIGIVPAAGKGSRLQPFRYPKELFPIGYTAGACPSGDTFRLRVVCEYSLECLVAARVSQAFVIISDHKYEVVRFFSDGEEHGLHLAYLHQRNANGLPQAIDCAYPWARSAVSALVLPDTIVEPSDSVSRILDYLQESTADAVLGIYPTDHPEDRRVISLHDKCMHRNLLNTWGTAAWTPTFTEFLHDYLKRNAAPMGRELTLAEILVAALAQGLRVDAVPFSEGRFWDIGKNSSLVKARREFDKLTSAVASEMAEE